MEYLIKTPCGELRGCATNKQGVVAYKGIRYATAGRFEYPREVTSWEGVYDATEYGACAYQPRSCYNEEEMPKKIFYYNEFRKGETYEYSEDCLFLNVFAPEKGGEKLPVLVYIHGGGFTGGCGHEKHFDVPVWPQKGMIGVTLNYRLGPLGFAVLPELKEEAGYTGNYGLYDQMTAIQWVKHNIEAFGGDPENITIMGQSAGGMSVQQHCLSPLTKGLFQKAVMCSGGGTSKILAASTPEKSYEFWQMIMEKCGASNLEEFRQVPVEKLFAVWKENKKHRWVAVAPLALTADWLLARDMKLWKEASSITFPTSLVPPATTLCPPFFTQWQKNGVRHKIPPLTFGSLNATCPVTTTVRGTLPTCGIGLAHLRTVGDPLRRRTMPLPRR